MQNVDMGVAVRAAALAIALSSLALTSAQAEGPAKPGRTLYLPIFTTKVDSRTGMGVTSDVNLVLTNVSNKDQHITVKLYDENQTLSLILANSSGGWSNGWTGSNGDWNRGDWTRTLVKSPTSAVRPGNSPLDWNRNPMANVGIPKGGSINLTWSPGCNFAFDGDAACEFNHYIGWKWTGGSEEAAWITGMNNNWRLRQGKVPTQDINFYRSNADQNSPGKINPMIDPRLVDCREMPYNYVCGISYRYQYRVVIEVQEPDGAIVGSLSASGGTVWGSGVTDNVVNSVSNFPLNNGRPF